MTTSFFAKDNTTEDFIKQKVTYGWCEHEDGCRTIHELTQEFIETHCSKFNNEDWMVASETLYPLDEEFLKKYKAKLDWQPISRFQELSEELMEECIDFVDFVEISTYQDLSEGFMEKYADRLSWWALAMKQEMSKEFIARHLNEIREPLMFFMMKKRDVGEDFFREHIDIFKGPFYVMDESETWVKKVIRVQELSDEFVMELQMRGYL